MPVDIAHKPAATAAARSFPYMRSIAFLVGFVIVFAALKASGLS